MIRPPDDEVEGSRRELRQPTYARPSWGVFTYFMGCFACQTFWTAAAIFAITRGVDDLAASLFTAAAYSAAVVMLSAFGIVRARPAAPGHAPGCTDCRR